MQSGLSADFNQINPSPIQVLLNTNANPSLVNSVDFHPNARLLCVAFTQNHSIVLYQIEESGEAVIHQILQGALSQLSCPQHALFSKDGESLIVANWCNQTFNIYDTDSNGFYQEVPTAVIPFPSPTESFRPHGMAFSPDGTILAVAYGASTQYPRAIALYQVSNLGTAQVHFRFLSLLQGNEIETGIPKGIAFSPDGSCLLVTLSETNSLILYTLDLLNEKIALTPKQILKGEISQLSRPEDIKFSAEGKYFAISNSDKDSITFYIYDNKNNSILSPSPFYILQNPRAKLSFPHGLAFSADGTYLFVTQFGSAIFDKDGNLCAWGTERSDSVAIYKLK